MRWISLVELKVGRAELKSWKSRRTFATPSTAPVMVRTRSWTPGTTLLTPALTPVCSRMSATFLPALPMITPASLVVTSARRVSVFCGSAFDGEGERSGDPVPVVAAATVAVVCHKAASAQS